MPYPYGVQTINSAIDTFNANLTTEKITPANTIKNYTIQLQTPVYDIEKMQNADFSTLPDAFISKYTQTPSDLPKRITTLANKVTKDANSIYDQTKAIENYLSKSGDFTYSTDDAQETPNGADYVDQFLFETKIGYCDNFSTSMVMMLRTLGIPARWAKGYTPGEGEKETNGDKSIYTITNNNAHSWPEVFFPGTGWVPFEPTATFSNPENFQEPTTETANKPDNPSESASEAAKPEQPEQTPEQEAGGSSTGEPPEEKTTKTNTSTANFDIPQWAFLILDGFIFLLLILTVIFRRWICCYLLLQSIKNRPLLSTTFNRLLKILGLYKYNRQSSETLRQFAGRVDNNLQIDSFSKLTRIYETQLYSQMPAKKQITDREINYIREIILSLQKKDS